MQTEKKNILRKKKKSALKKSNSISVCKSKIMTDKIFSSLREKWVSVKRHKC